IGGDGRRRVDRGDGQRKGGAAAEFAFDGNGAAQQLGELLRKRKAEAGPPNLALHRVLDLREFLEDDALVLRGEADAGIGDAEYDIAPVRKEARGYPHLALFGELQRVRNEVAQDLGDLAVVRAKLRNILGLLEYEVDRSVEHQRAQHAAQRSE